MVSLDNKPVRPEVFSFIMKKNVNHVTHHTSCSLLRFTLPAEPGAGGNLNNAIAGWGDTKDTKVKHENKEVQTDYLIQLKFGAKIDELFQSI